uniref:Cilia- and flagella-associated protein 44 n=1 Tax=Phallusia mammillata TaxID=59560 RepID=A0A6F9D9S5_9ASCI|nr:WD repeat-containing protein 52-like [Phallusia mammillata]
MYSDKESLKEKLEKPDFDEDHIQSNFILSEDKDIYDTSSVSSEDSGNVGVLDDIPSPTESEKLQKRKMASEEKDADMSKEEEEGPAKDFFYELEEYQSISKSSDESGIPSNLLQFYHSFGYDCCKRANLHLLKGPTLVFAAGNLVNILNLSTGEHRFLRSCGGGGIGAIAVHPSGKYFVVAEKGTKPHILIYEFPSLKLYRILRDGTEQAYSFVDFSPKGDLLASVGSYPDYMLTVWAWEKEKIMLRSKAFSQEVYRVTFSPEMEGQLTSCGTTHIRFWKMAFTFTGLKLKGELGRFGKTSLSDIDGYIQLPDGKVLSGSDWGNMLLWDGGLIKVEICRKNQKPCHHGSIQQLVIDEGELITIGLDGYVRVWEMEAIDSADTTDESDHFEIEPMNELKVGNDVQLTCMVKAQPEDDPSMEEGASIWFAQDSNGGIWKLDLSFSHTTKPPEKLYSFTAGSITGLASSPSSHLMAATGDSYVRIYDYLTKELVCQYHSPNVQSKGSSLLWPNKVVDPKGTSIIAGFSDGIMRLLCLRNVDDTNELSLVQALKPHSSTITAMSFDNSGEILATGSTDKTVFFFAVDQGGYEPIGFVKIPGEVTCMQWSPPGFPDNTLLVSCSNGKVVEITAPSLSSVDTTHTYKLSDIPMRYFAFQSIKSRLRRDEERLRKEKEKAKRRKDRERELKRKRDRGEEISDEDAAAFLDEDPEAAEEEEEEPLYFPPEPNPILQAFYVTPGRFVLSMGDYDAGYLYECVFPDDSSSDEDATNEPIKAIPVQESSDVPITTIRFSSDRHKVFVGFQNGQIRVYPIEADPEATFDLDMLGSNWNLNMHDNQHGRVTNIEESHDGSYVFSCGGDGNLFGFYSLAHEEIVKSMEGKRASLPSPHKRSADDRLIDDIDDPHAYSIEDAKLKAEHDKMMRDAEAKKLTERKRINKLRKSFLELLHKNSELPSHAQLKREEFELDPSIRMKMLSQTQDRIERVRLEMQWDKEKLALAHRKIEGRFRSQLECDRIVVHAFNSSHTVASYRVAKLPDEYYSLKQTVEQRVRAASLASEGFATVEGMGTSLPSERGNETDDADDASFLNEAKRKAKKTILHGRQAEKVAKAIKKAEEAKLKHEKRQNEWKELFKSKPDKKYEDPADVAAIKEAQANMGDFKLKTSSDYVVPEHLRMDTEKKRYQILILQGLIHRAKSDFNNKLIHIRDAKFELISEMRNYSQEMKAIQSRMSKEDRLRLPHIPHPHPEEEPHKKFEFTRQTLLNFEEEEKEREIAEAKKKRKGDGGLFGGFGDEPPPETLQVKDLKHSSRKSASSIASSVRSKAMKGLPRSESSGPTVLEQQIAQIENIRLRHQRDRLLRSINEKMTSFDAELRLLRHDKTKLDVDLKMADLRHVTLLEELLLLKEYEKRETTLSGRVTGKRNELAEINGRAAEMQVRLESKKRDIERLVDREKALYASFTSSLGDNNKFADFLNKVFKKKIKRAKKKIVQEGEEEDSDMSSSDESDWSSEEDEDDSVEGGFDDSVCPPGCDQQLFDSTLVLRERRLDLEEALAEEKKLAETLKKDVDALGKKAKVMESQLKNALDDLEAFQVEKQGKLNELDVVVPLRFHQVEHVYNATIPPDLSSCLVFANSSLTALQRRIKELQQEKSEQRKFYKEARQQHVHLIKSGRLMEERIQQLEEKCEQAMMLKFGRIVDLDKLNSVTVNKNVEELKEQVRLNEVKNARQLLKLQHHIDDLRDRITGLTRDNTNRLERLNVLMNDNNSLEVELDHRQKHMELEERGKKKSEIREQHRLVQLVQLQAQEIQALKEEIGLLSRKGGHILPPAQPPLGQDPDVM